MKNHTKPPIYQLFKILSLEVIFVVFSFSPPPETDLANLNHFFNLFKHLLNQTFRLKFCGKPNGLGLAIEIKGIRMEVGQENVLEFKTIQNEKDFENYNSMRTPCR